ncbi:MAG: lactate utilization protein, partial [Thermodesulfobacteriota bacterium]
MNTDAEVWKRHFPTATSGAHLFPEFEMRARAVSGEVFRVPDAAEARETLIRLVDGVGAKKAVVVESPLQEAAGITEALRSRGVTVYTEPADIAAHAETADIGISGVEFGIAETGSVFQDGGAIATRLVTILPPLHVVFLPSANIVPGITEAFDIISQSFDRGYVSFITGPSRTAAIERVL